MCVCVCVHMYVEVCMYGAVEMRSQTIGESDKISADIIGMINVTGFAKRDRIFPKSSICANFSTVIS